MRIIGGEKGGRRLSRLRAEGIRPLRDRVRAALFDTLGEVVVDAEVLDLFAGTGAVGLEALSRGARRAVFVDSSPQATRLVQENAKILGYQDKVEILCDEFHRALKSLETQGKRFDLVFIGAPYTSGLADQALKAPALSRILRPGAWVVVETFHKEDPGEAPPLVRQFSRTYGETRLTYFQVG